MKKVVSDCCNETLITITNSICSGNVERIWPGSDLLWSGSSGNSQSRLFGEDSTGNSFWIIEILEEILKNCKVTNSSLRIHPTDQIFFKKIKEFRIKIKLTQENVKNPIQNQNDPHPKNFPQSTPTKWNSFNRISCLKNLKQTRQARRKKVLFIQNFSILFHSFIHNNEIYFFMGISKNNV